MSDWVRGKIGDLRLRRILEDVILKLQKDPGTDGIFLRSSFALGMMTSQSDLDIGVISRNKRGSETWTQYEIPVHIHYFDKKIADIIGKDEKEPEFLLHLPLIKSFGNIVPLFDKKGIVSSLQQKVLERKLSFAKLHMNEMGKQLNDAYGLFQKEAYRDAVIVVRKAAAEGVLTFLNIAGMPSAKDKYIFSLFSSFKTKDKEIQDLGEEILHLLTKIHGLEACDQEDTAEYLLYVGRMFQMLSTMLERA